jgi:hypothetical protein
VAADESSSDFESERLAQVAAPEPPFGAAALEDLEGLDWSRSLAAVRALLPELARQGVKIDLHWPSDNLDDAARWDFVREAQALGLEVRPWLTLPTGDQAIEDQPSSPEFARTGFFPNSTNYAAWIDASLSLLRMWRDRGLKPTVAVIDYEMRKNRLLQLAHYLNSDPAKAIELLVGGIDRARQARAISAFAQYTEEAHALGFAVHATTLLPMLDDAFFPAQVLGRAANSDALRQAFGVPLPIEPRDLSADTISFQAHRTLYSKSFAALGGLTPYFVYDYARKTIGEYGAKSAIDVGLTHAGISPDNGLIYTSPEQLRDDVAAARAAGIPTSRIGVYSLGGMLDLQTGTVAPGWLAPPRAPFVPPPDLTTGLSQGVWKTLDLAVTTVEQACRVPGLACDSGRAAAVQSLAGAVFPGF